jgi:uncharacterized damage-inducible protein DinB
MSIAQDFMTEFEHEGKTTRRVLERVPDGKFDWAPHARSLTLGKLAGHVAGIPGMGVIVLSETERDVATPGAAASRPATPVNAAELVQRWDENFAKLRTLLADTGDAAMQQIFVLRAGENVMFRLPRAQAVRAMVMSHLIHHRGQLSVYLRMLDVPVPSIYGPSADEAAAPVGGAAAAAKQA